MDNFLTTLELFEELVKQSATVAANPDAAGNEKINALRQQFDDAIAKAHKDNRQARLWILQQRYLALSKKLHTHKEDNTNGEARNKMTGELNGLLEEIKQLENIDPSTLFTD